MAITDIKALGQKMGEQEYRLPGWAPGEDFVCKLRRPTLTGMTAIAGFVPNPLMPVIASLFLPTGKKIDAIPQDQQSKAMQAMAQYALVEPTYEEIMAAGLELTDQQYASIYAFALGGAPALSTFRGIAGGKPGGDGADLQRGAVAAGGD